MKQNLTKQTDKETVTLEIAKEMKETPMCTCMITPSVL